MSEKENLPAIVSVPFHDDVIEALQTSDGRVWASLKRLCEALGIAFERQFTKLKSKKWATVTVMVMVAQDGKRREHTMIGIDSMALWLAGVSENRVRPEVREKLERYQLEAKDVLAAHFFGSPQPAPAVPMVPVPEFTLEQALRIALERIEGEKKALALAESERRGRVVDEESVKQLEGTVETMKVKVGAFDTIATIKEDDLLITDAAKVLAVNPDDLFQYMADRTLQGKGWIYKRRGGKKWIACQHRLDNGDLRYKSVPYMLDGKPRISQQVIITPKGFAKIAETFEATKSIQAGMQLSLFREHCDGEKSPGVSVA